MSACKFCGVAEGTPDRRGDSAHINRDGLCAACYYVLERVKYQPDKLSEDDWAWFVDMCAWNYKHGMFVPVKQRKELRANEPWRCASCGQSDTLYQDDHYKRYCTTCAKEARRGRVMPEQRKERSDKGKKHFTGVPHLRSDGTVH